MKNIKMKKMMNLKSIIVVLFLVSLCSCEEDKNFEETNKKSNLISNVKQSEFSYDLNGEKVFMLEFDSKEDFLKTVASLELEDEFYNDSFYSKFKDEFDKDSSFYVIEEDYGFDNQKVYKDYEKSYNYISMRSIYELLEKNWLESCKYDTVNAYPYFEELYPYSIAEQTLFNKYGEVKIGDSILKVVHGDYIVFGGSDTSNLVKYNLGDTSVLNKNNILNSFCFTKDSEYCVNDKDTTYEIYPLQVENITIPVFMTTIKVSFYNCWFFAKTYVRSNFYVYNSNKSKYVSAGTKQSIGMSDTQLYDIACSYNTEIIIPGAQKEKTKHRIVLSDFILQTAEHYRIQLGESLGVGYKFFGNNSNFYIDFWDPYVMRY